MSKLIIPPNIENDSDPADPERMPAGEKIYVKELEDQRSSPGSRISEYSLSRLGGSVTQVEESYGIPKVAADFAKDEVAQDEPYGAYQNSTAPLESVKRSIDLDALGTTDDLIEGSPSMSNPVPGPLFQPFLSLGAQQSVPLHPLFPTNHGANSDSMDQPIVTQRDLNTTPDVQESQSEYVNTEDDGRKLVSDGGGRMPPSDAPVISTVSTEQMELKRPDGEEIVSTAKTYNGDPEFEVDSSPLNSSSSDMSSDTSSSDDSDDDYKMLGPEEQAHRLMQEDGASDHEGGARNANGLPLRTLNEKVDEVVEKPDVIITADMEVEELGLVEHLIDNIVLIRATTSGEYRVLESGSVLCLGDRNVIGVVAEVLGRVQQPLYSVRFTNGIAIGDAGIEKGAKIYYAREFSTFVFTQPLKTVKGSDASNIHDEEVGDDEMEFSDDDAEAEYKKKLKVQRQIRKGGGTNRGSLLHHGAHKNLEQAKIRNDADISYDDPSSVNLGESEADEPYTPLSRPSNLHEMMSHKPATPQLRRPQIGINQGRGESFGRGDRGRGRKSQGRLDVRRGSNSRTAGRGTFTRGVHSSDSNQPPPPPPNNHDNRWNSVSSPLCVKDPQHLSPQSSTGAYPVRSPSFVSVGSNPMPFSSQSSFAQQSPGSYANPYSSYPPRSPYDAPPSLYGHLPHDLNWRPQQTSQYSNSTHENQSPSSTSHFPPGAFINPAFFNGQGQLVPSPQYIPSQSQWPSVNPAAPVQSSYVAGFDRSQAPSETDVAFKAAQDRLNVLRQLSGGL
ncbi:hypothetical protein MMC09_000336 [Bachmanniomyces sp. S44760]|nr:hypothetical protein [Bachmanniomyces sp. S44760]